MKSALRKIDRLMLAGTLSSIWSASKGDSPCCSLSAFLISRAQRSVSKKHYRSAERRFRYAACVQLRQSCLLNIWSAFRLSRSDINAKVIEEQLEKESRQEEVVRSLFVVYRYLVYFGDFREAQIVRANLVNICCDIACSNEECSVKGFAFVAALEKMPYEALYQKLHRFLAEKECRATVALNELLDYLDCCVRTNKERSSVALIVGPRGHSERDLEVIKNSAHIVRLNKNPISHLPRAHVNGTCDLVYWNSEFPLKIHKNGEPIDPEIPLFKFRKEDAGLADRLKEKYGIRYGLYARPNKVFVNGNANMVPSAVYDLLFDGYVSRLVGVDFFTSKKLYDSAHYSASKEENENNMLVRNHDALSNFAFLKSLAKEGLVSCSGETTVLDELSVAQYAQKLQERFGGLEL